MNNVKVMGNKNKGGKLRRNSWAVLRSHEYNMKERFCTGSFKGKRKARTDKWDRTNAKYVVAYIWPKVKHNTRIWLFKPNLGKNLLNSSSEIITTTTYSYHCVTCILSKSEPSSKVGAFKTKAPPQKKKKKEYLTLFSPLFNNLKTCY